MAVPPVGGSSLALLDGLDTTARLDYLLLLLQNLPVAIPTSTSVYKFHRYTPSVDDIEKWGSPQGAVGNYLAISFGDVDSGARAFFVERGEGLDGVVALLQNTIANAQDGTGAKLERWVDHLIQSALAEYAHHATKVPALKRKPKPRQDRLAEPVRPAPSSSSRSGPARTPKPAAHPEPTISRHEPPAHQSVVATGTKRSAPSAPNDEPPKKKKPKDIPVAAPGVLALPRPAATSSLVLNGHGVAQESTKRTHSSSSKTVHEVSDSDDDVEMAEAAVPTRGQSSGSTPSAGASQGRRTGVALAPMFLGAAAKRAGAAAPSTAPSAAREEPASSSAPGAGEDAEDEAQGSSSDDERLPNKKAVSAARADKSKARTWHWDPDDLTDIEEKIVKTGRKPIQIVRTLTIPCRSRKWPDKLRFRCSQGECRESFGSRQKERVLLHHIKECAYIRDDLRDEAIAAMADGSLGAQVAKLDAAEQDAAAAASATSASASGSGAPKAVALQDIARTAGLAAQQTRFDLAILRLWARGGIAARILDYDEWKDAVRTANPRLETFSSTHLLRTLMPMEAVRVTKLAVDHLRQLDDLTVSYDGGSSNLVESIYTVHVTTAESRTSFLLAGDESSGLSHTTEYIVELAMKVMQEIGLSKFICAVSDSTNATKKARNEIAAAIETLLPLADAPHHLNLMIKDIAALVYFAKMVSQSRQLLRFFKMSSFGKQRLKTQAQSDGVSRHLETIGKTRFASINRACHSIVRNLPSVKSLVDTDAIFVTKKERESFAFLRGRSQFTTYDTTIRQLVAVLTPAAKALKCLESAQDLFSRNETELELPDEVVEQVTSIVNARYSTMCEGPDNAIYKAALFLDPTYIKCSFWVKRSASGGSSTQADGDLCDSIPCYVEIGEFLARYLFKHVKSGKSAVLRSYDTPKAIVDAFRSQFRAYARQESPFNRDASQGWRLYWNRLSQNDGADVLAFLARKLLSMLPNSMPEERSMSAVTKAQSGRPGMKASTIIAEVQVKQHYARERQEKQAQPKAPTILKFRDLAAHIRSEVICASDRFHYRRGVDTSSTQSSAPENDAQPDSDGEDDSEEFGKVFNEVESHDAPAGDGSGFLGFTAAEKVTLGSTFLLDLLSDVPLDIPAGDTATGATRAPKAPAKRVSYVLNEEDFKFVL